MKKAVVGIPEHTTLFFNFKFLNLTKRLGNLVPLICTRENIERSIKVVLRGTKRKRTKIAKYILSHEDEVIDETIKCISNGSFRLGSFTEREIKDGYKIRTIQILNYRDRIVVNAIMEILDNLLTKGMIYTTASSIKGRGTHYLKNIVQRDIRNNPEETKYFYKIDIKKYYPSIDHDLMKVCIRRYIKDEAILPILDNFIDMVDKGLSIGLRAAQVFGNLFLGWLLDMVLKCEYQVRFYYRYYDDIVILGKDKEQLWDIHNLICYLLKDSKLTIKPNYRIAPTSEGIDFLGFVIYSGIYCKVRKRIKKKAEKKLKKIKSNTRRKEIISSVKGYCLHSNGHNLFNKLIRIYGI
jgi:hypothetical protein